MSTASHLVEQHVQESAARLRHVDELMDRARRATQQRAAPASMEAVLQRIQAERDHLARELEAIRGLPAAEASEAARRGQGLQGTLGAIGLELEKALTSVLDVPR